MGISNNTLTFKGEDKMFYDQKSPGNTRMVVNRSDLLRMLKERIYFFTKLNKNKIINCNHLVIGADKTTCHVVDLDFKRTHLYEEKPLGDMIKNQKVLKYYQKLPSQIIRYVLRHSKAQRKIVQLENLDYQQLFNIAESQIPVKSCSIVYLFGQKIASELGLFKKPFALLTKQYQIDLLVIEFSRQQVMPSIKNSTQAKHKDYDYEVMKIQSPTWKILWDTNKQININSPLQLDTTLDIYNNLPQKNIKTLSLDCDNLLLTDLESLGLCEKIGSFVQKGRTINIILNKEILDNKVKLSTVANAVVGGILSISDINIVFCDAAGYPYCEIGQPSKPNLGFSK
jgi:hypothetical protein